MKRTKKGINGLSTLKNKNKKHIFHHKVHKDKNKWKFLKSLEIKKLELWYNKRILKNPMINKNPKHHHQVSKQ